MQWRGGLCTVPNHQSQILPRTLLPARIVEGKIAVFLQGERRMSLRRPANSIMISLLSLFVAIGTIVAMGASVPAQSSAPPANAPAQTRQPPPVSPLGARNDLPNLYLAGVSWGQFPNGRKWGSTAGIAVGPDGNIWAIDRCGAFGSRGTNCVGSPLDPVLEFDSSGKLLKSFGKGLFVSPHKIT